MRPLTSVAEKPGIAPVITLNVFTSSRPAIRTVSGSFLPSFLVIIFQLDIWLYEQREELNLTLLCSPALSVLIILQNLKNDFD